MLVGAGNFGLAKGLSKDEIAVSAGVSLEEVEAILEMEGKRD